MKRAEKKQRYIRPLIIAVSVFISLVFSDTLFATTASAISYTIEYKENTAANMPESVFGGLSVSTSAILANNTPSRSGFQFLGWCDQATTKSGDTDTCTSGHQHQPGGTVTLNATANANNIKLYAMWGPMTMQSVATWGSTLSTGDEVTATDVRDGKKYTVTKLSDGNIWMTQNLDHDIGDIAGGTYTSADTDISANWTPSTATYATGNTTWNHSNTAPESYDPGDLCWNGTIRSDWNGTISTDITTCGNDKHYHIGNYYNWTAAVAMNGSSSYTTQNTDANQSICPAGWRLPIGGTSNTGSKSFQYLVNQLSLTSGTSGNIQNSPVYFVYGGYWSGSSYDVGGGGLYWSSVVGDGSLAYLLYFNRNGYLRPQTSDGRDLGFSVRCVAR